MTTAVKRPWPRGDFGTGLHVKKPSTTPLPWWDTPIYGLYRYVPLQRVGFFGSLA